MMTLGQWIVKVRRAAESGEPLGLAPDDADDRESHKTWSDDRTIPAAALRAVLTDPGVRVDPHGIEIRGAKFADSVDLQYVTFDYQLRLYQCVFEQCFNAKYARIRGLTLSKVTFSGGVLATGATIDGQLDLTHATLANSNGSALDLQGTTITNNLLAHALDATGMIDARGVIIGGTLNLTGATLKRDPKQKGRRRALALDRAQINGSVFAGVGMVSGGTTRAMKVTGGVSAIGLKVGGALDLDGVTIFSPDVDGDPGSVALALDRAHITSNLFARNGFDVSGTVRAMGATIGGRLYLDGADLRNGADDRHPDQCALILDHANIGEGICAGKFKERGQIDRPFRATGMIRAHGVTIGGSLDITGAKLCTPGTAGKDGRSALDLSSARITGSVLAGRGDEPYTTPCRVVGTVSAVGATIGHRFDISGATIENPHGIALNLEAATVSRLILTPKVFIGTVKLVRAQVADLIVGEYPPQPLMATGWAIGDVRSPRSTPGLRWKWKRAHQWLDTTSAAIHPPDTSDRKKKRKDKPPGWLHRHIVWLLRNKPVSVQPWHALADVYDRNGDPAAARHLRFAAENKITAQSPFRTRVVRIGYCLVAGYGYFPLASIASMLAVLAISVVIVHCHRNDIVPADSTAKPTTVEKHLGEQNAWMESFTFTVDDVLPPAGAKDDDWKIPSTASTALVLGLPATKLGLWSLAALFLAGVSGLLRGKKN